jgi:hypothetical protein
MTTPTNLTPDRITPEEFRRAFQELYERLDQLANELTTLREVLATAASQPQPAAPTGQTVTFDATILLMSYDDNGQPVYKVKGGQYQKFGVRV